jgi:Proline dehydrogenase
MCRGETGRRVQRLVEGSPLARDLVRRYIAGETPDEAVRVAGELAAEGLPVTIEYIGEPEHAGPGGPGRHRAAGRTAAETAAGKAAAARAERTVAEYLRLLDVLAARGLARGADLTVDLGALDPLAGERGPVERVARVCEAARDAGATVTLEFPERHVPAERALAVHAALREDHPGLGVTIPACLRAAAEHCRRLSGSRVRLRKGVRDAPAAVAHRDAREIDRSFVRCLRILMAGHGHPMVATVDRRMIEIASVLATLNERAPGGFEYVMPYGVRPATQRRLRELGAALRVHVPYGSDWYDYLLRRL